MHAGEMKVTVTVEYGEDKISVTKETSSGNPLFATGAFLRAAHDSATEIKDMLVSKYATIEKVRKS